MGKDLLKALKDRGGTFPTRPRRICAVEERSRGAGEEGRAVDERGRGRRWKSVRKERKGRRGSAERENDRARATSGAEACL